MRTFLIAIVIYPFLVSAILRLKFKDFFPFYRPYFINASSRCATELDNYWSNNRTACSSPCACAADCLLDNLPGTIQTNMASAAVLLGLIPPTLIFTGPSLTEMAALSLYNPLLAILLSLASPAINLQRLFRREDILEEIERPISVTFRQYQMWLDRHELLKPTMSLLKWLLAFASLANNISNSVYLDLRTISGWRCGALFMPLVWSLLACVVHSFAMIAVRLRRYSTRAPLWRHGWRDLPGSHDTSISECLMWAGSLLAIVHMLFGILDLSSLVFISALDALPTAIRYGTSAIVCQIITLTELASLRWKLKEDLYAHSRAHQTDPVSEEINLSTTKRAARDRRQRGSVSQTW